MSDFELIQSLHSSVLSTHHRRAWTLRIKQEEQHRISKKKIKTADIAQLASSGKAENRQKPLQKVNEVSLPDLTSPSSEIILGSAMAPHRYSPLPHPNLYKDLARHRYPSYLLHQVTCPLRQRLQQPFGPLPLP